MTEALSSSEPAQATFSTNELEARLLFAVIVAGKSEKFANRALSQLWSHSRGDGPFDMIRRLVRENYLDRAVQMARTGNYNKMGKAFREIVSANLDLRSCTAADLIAIHGIGPKTANFFIIWTRPGAECAALDTHVLKWLRYLGYSAPKSTPQGPKYTQLEALFLGEARRRGLTARTLDSMIWDWCSSGQSCMGTVWPTELQKLPI